MLFASFMCLIIGNRWEQLREDTMIVPLAQ